MASETPVSDARRAAARILRFAGIAAAAVFLLAVAVAAFLSSRPFAAAVEARLANAVLASKQRTLTFHDPLQISFWPRATAQAGRIALSEPNGAGEFASVGAARFSVALLPLFRGRLVVDRCEVEGLAATVVRRRDGTLNIDDLLGDREPSDSDIAIEAPAVSLRGSRLAWRDEAAGTGIAAEGIEFSAAGLKADTGAKTMRADQLSLSARIGDTRLRLDVYGLDATATALATERAAFDLRYAAGGAAFGASLGSRLGADFERGSLVLGDISGSFDAAHPRLVRPVAVALRGALNANRKSADAKLTAQFEGSNAFIKLDVTRYSPPAVQFDVNLDRLDLDRYLSPDDSDAPDKPSAGPPPALKGIELAGTAAIGSLKVAGLTTSNIRLEVRAADGQVDVRQSGRRSGK